MKPEIHKVTLNRKSEAELDIGIRDLELRGFKLIKRGEQSEEFKIFDDRKRRERRPSFKGSETVNRHIAVMTREYHREVAK